VEQAVAPQPTVWSPWSGATVSRVNFSLDMLAYGEPMVEFNQTGQGSGRLCL